LGWQKTFKIQRDLGRLSTLTANISGTQRYRQAVNGVINYNQFGVEQKIDELWFSNNSG